MAKTNRRRTDQDAVLGGMARGGKRLARVAPSLRLGLGYLTPCSHAFRSRRPRCGAPAEALPDTIPTDYGATLGTSVTILERKKAGLVSAVLPVNSVAVVARRRQNRVVPICTAGRRHGGLLRGRVGLLPQLNDYGAQGFDLSRHGLNREFLFPQNLVNIQIRHNKTRIRKRQVAGDGKVEQTPCRDELTIPKKATPFLGPLIKEAEKAGMSGKTIQGAVLATSTANREL